MLLWNKVGLRVQTLEFDSLFEFGGWVLHTFGADSFLASIFQSDGIFKPIFGQIFVRSFCAQIFAHVLGAQIFAQIFCGFFFDTLVFKK